MEATITTIDLLRHGECEGGHLYRGSIDIALTAKGRQQMKNNLDSICSSWDRVVSSPLIRCANFAEELSNEKGLPLELKKDLQEMHFGDWEGQAVDKIWETQQQAVEAWLEDPVLSPPPSGEPADSFALRVTASFSGLVAQYPGEHLLLITHGGVIRVLLAHCLSMPLTAVSRIDIPYACFSQIQVIVDREKTFYRLISHNVHSCHASFSKA